MAKNWYIGTDNFPKRNLPNGYTQIKYIQSSGTQYINTGIKPNNKTKIIVDFELFNNTTLPTVFGAWNGENKDALMFVLIENMARACMFYASHYTYSSRNDPGWSGRHTIRVSNGVFTVDNELAVGILSGFTFTTNYPLYLLAYNNVGSPENLTCGRIYSAQIYDDETLVRDLVPCKNSSGIVGMYDCVTGAFFGNYGSGVFTAGEAYTAGGIARKVERPYIGVSGVARKIDKGYVGVNGVARQFYSGSITIDDLSIGSSVYTTVDGKRTEFLIVERGRPSMAYDSSCDGIWLLMKDIYQINTVYNNSNSWYEDYTQCDIQDTLNTILGKFSSAVQNSIKQVKIPYLRYTNPNDLSTCTLCSGSDGFSTKLFLLSLREVGEQTYDSNFPDEGARLSYFSGVYNDALNSKRIAYYNGTASSWWLRSLFTLIEVDVGLYEYARYIYDTGASTIGWKWDKRGVRPAFVMPRTTVLDKSFNIIA